MGLTPKQKKFADLYMADKDMNGTKAYMKAYPLCKTEDTASSNASRTLRIAKVHDYIEDKMRKRSQKLEIKAEDILKGIMEVRDNCLQKVDVNGLERVVDVNGVLKASELLGKHLKLFTDKVEHSGELKLPEIIIKRGK